MEIRRSCGGCMHLDALDHKQSKGSWMEGNETKAPM
jgi:hypothetical protein